MVRPAPPSHPQVADARPLLLLDVDGVVCPLFPPPPGRPALYVSVPETPFKKVWIDPELPHWLKTLQPLYRMVWASSWEEAANQSLRTALGLPILPVLLLPHLRTQDGDTYKLETVRNYVRNESFAWVDDVLGAGVHHWADSRSAPTLLVETRSRMGIHEGDFRELLDFGQQMARGRGDISLITDSPSHQSGPHVQTSDQSRSL